VVVPAGNTEPASELVLSKSLLIVAPAQLSPNVGGSNSVPTAV
jgi:hypothetical protein